MSLANSPYFGPMRVITSLHIGTGSPRQCFIITCKACARAYRQRPRQRGRSKLKRHNHQHSISYCKHTRKPLAMDDPKHGPLFVEELEARA